MSVNETDMTYPKSAPEYIMLLTAKDGWKTVLLVVKTCVIDLVYLVLTPGVWCDWIVLKLFIDCFITGPHDHVKIYCPDGILHIL